jgi:hypothetical protein
MSQAPETSCKLPEGIEINYVTKLSDKINQQIRCQESLIGNLRHRIEHCRDSDYEIKLNAMLAHALAGLAALCRE